VVGAFSLKISIAPSGETIARIKKVREVQKWYGPPLSPCHVSLFVTLWNYKVCGNGNAMKQCNFQNNYGTVA